ncbi:Reverse transcriptase RNA-dependent DNA polymerase [Trinorchestia longiramus]|nr:Reverse transcriptase RNA-dependent DNA polymerase [Trinorchestia longiramus]
MKENTHGHSWLRTYDLLITATVVPILYPLGHRSYSLTRRLNHFNTSTRKDVVFNESQFISFEKEPSKEIECVPCSFTQEEKYEDSEGELELCRSTRNRAAPDRFGEWVCFAQDKFDVSANVEEALHGSESKLWKAAMEEKMASMNINNVWSLVECPKNKKPIRCKWIFKKKAGPDENVCSYKARLVAQGYAQKFGVDYDETFSPVSKDDGELHATILGCVHGHVEVLPISASSRRETRNSSYSLPGFEPARSLSAQAETRYRTRVADHSTTVAAKSRAVTRVDNLSGSDDSRMITRSSSTIAGVTKLRPAGESGPRRQFTRPVDVELTSLPRLVVAPPTL